MRIGILKTGDLPPEMEAQHGTYADICGAMLTRAAPDLGWFGVDVDGGAALGRPTDADGWLITGSRHGAYEDHVWIPPLEGFLREALTAKIPVFGICFGHQILAQAMGGTVIKSPKGWGLGVHRYRKTGDDDALAPLDRDWSAIAIHQDQVVAVPKGAAVLAGSDFCPNAVLAYGDPARPQALTLQAHPEYDAALFRTLIEMRMTGKIAPARIDSALRGLSEKTAASEWARIATDFFRRANAHRDAA